MEVALKRYRPAGVAMARTFCFRAKNWGLDLEDLIIESELGIAKAVRTWDPNCNVDFDKHCGIVMRDTIRDRLRAVGGRHFQRLVPIALSDEMAAVLPSEEESFAVVELIYDLSQAVRGHRFANVRTFNLYLAGELYKDIAAKEGISASRVSQRVEFMQEKLSSVLLESPIVYDSSNSGPVLL